MRIVRGLPPGLVADAAGLYWDAFGAKLGAVLGPKRRALAFLQDSIRPDHAICALSDDGRLIGIVGFKTPEGALVDADLSRLQAGYGRFGGLWRGLLLGLLERDIENERFLLDGICVSPEARGSGAGTALLQAVADEARARGFRELRLDVIDTNPRARALYERNGFVPLRTERLGPLRMVFGFAASTAMVKPL